MKIFEFHQRNYENIENPRIPLEMQEDHANPGVPFETMKKKTVL